MAGEKEPVMDEWRVSDPSPRTFLASLMGGGDLSSKGYSVVAGDDDGELVVASPAKEGGETEDGKDGGDCFSRSDLVSAPRPPSSRGSLAERMAARTGFNAPKLNTDCIRSTSSPFPGIRSPYLTISPGLSPTMFLDSPMFLSNSLTQQSPTTGKFPFGSFGDGCFLTSSTAVEKGKDSLSTVAPAPFAFRPPLESISLDFSSGENKPFTAAGTRQQYFPSIEVSVQSAGQIPDIKLSSTKANSQNELEFCSQQNLQVSSSCKDIPALRIPQNVANNGGDSPPFYDQCDEDQKGEFSSGVVGAPAEDGYHWRKYGQKQVKGSEFPRSYYKCGHPSCPVKKKVERSLEGHVTEIIYKGTHTHQKPLPNRRPGVGSTQTPAEGDNNGVTEQNLDGVDARWTAAQQSFTNGRVDWMANGGMNKAPPGLIPTEFYDPSLTMRGPGIMETADLRDLSSTMSNENDDDDRVTNGSVSLGCEEEEDESESKRRKLDVCVSEISGATRAIREPRVVVQTTSEVDILDDGYRWRKYGQKVVKGNPNPRSYYKCTHPGCTVRKHVERASHDLKSVITTYEGKHNHDVPAAKNSSHHLTSAPPSAAPRPQQSQNHGNLRMFDQPAVLGAFNMPGRTQMPPIPSYTYGMGQPTLPNISMAGLGSAAYGKLPGLPLPHHYLGQQQQQQFSGKPNEWATVMPKGEPSEELPLNSDLRVPNGSAAYHQLISRMPLGPQL